MSSTYSRDNSSSDIESIKDALLGSGHSVSIDDFVGTIYEELGKKVGSATLFGTHPLALAQGEKDDSVWSATLAAFEDDLIGSQDIVIGRIMGGNLITYSTEDRFYHLTDSTDGNNIFKYETLDELLYTWSHQGPIDGAYEGPP